MVATTKLITSWSFSRYRCYCECPYKAKLKFVDKLKEPGSPAMDRGDAIHKMAEAYIKGHDASGKKVTKLAPELKKFDVLLKKLRKLNTKDPDAIFVEGGWYFTKDWAKTTWNDWAKCWLRVKMDVAYREGGVLHVIDWKTGKFRPEENATYMEQLELYALAALIDDETIEAVVPSLRYLDHGITYPDAERSEEVIVYTRKDVAGLKKTWLKRIKAMLVDTRFNPRPNNRCRYCHFRKENGGPCKF